MKKYLLIIGFVATIALAISGCLLITGQTTFIESVDAGYSTNLHVAKVWVNLYENSDYADHIKNIKSIDAVSFVAKIYNQGTLANKAELYISSDSNLTTVSQIRSNATKVLTSPLIPGQDSVLIKWNDSFKYMSNQSVLENYVLKVGMFEVYGIADTTPFQDSIQAEIVVTATVGK
jgi:hypothetical protein